ncbi:MAG: phosphatase family protein [Candidatus Saccharibacteria bacterium]|nr:phosphatase family protein [Candidatus Saccharibacteria bacterium]
MHTIVTLVAKDFILLSPLVLLYVWLRLSKAKKIEAIYIGVVAAVLAVLLAVIGSRLFNDPRPFVAGHFTPYFAHGKDNGFPSDHALIAGLFAAITYVYSKRFGTLAFIIAALIGGARVIAGIHHVIDIIASLAFACLATFIAQLLVRRYTTKAEA